MEVETPVCLTAPIPEPHIHALPAACGYLQTSPEICMKQLLSAGFEKIFQICRCFRASERGRRHLPEFTMLEWYAAGQTYTGLMHNCEALMEQIRTDLSLPAECTWQSQTIQTAPPWPRMRVAEAFSRFGGQSMESALAEGTFDEIMGLAIEPQLGFARPVFLCDYPAKTSLLASPKPREPELAQRFELYMAGLEICNGCTELADAELQKKRLEEELERRRKADLPLTPPPTRFLEALEAMPEAAGCALGIDRLVMLLTDSAEIDEVVAFPPEPP